MDRSKRYYLVSQLMEHKLTELELSYLQDGPTALIEQERETFEKLPSLSLEFRNKSDGEYGAT